MRTFCIILYYLYYECAGYGISFSYYKGGIYKSYRKKKSKVYVNILKKPVTVISVESEVNQGEVWTGSRLGRKETLGLGGKFGKKQTSPRCPTWSTTWWQKRMMTEQERNFAWKALWTNFGNWRFRIEVSLRVKCDKLACRPNRIVSWVKWGGTLQTSYPAG